MWEREDRTDPEKTCNVYASRNWIMGVRTFVIGTVITVNCFMLVYKVQYRCIVAQDQHFAHAYYLVRLLTPFNSISVYMSANEHLSPLDGALRQFFSFRMSKTY